MQTPEALNDLAQKARSGNEEALLQLWQGVSRLAYKIAMKYAPLCNGAADRDDLEQCAFLGFLESLGSFDPLRGNFSTWVCWYVRRACRKLLGLDRDSPWHMESLDAPIPGTDDLILADTIPDESAALPFDQTELRRDIDNALHRLPPHMADIIRRHDLEGLTIEDAGASIGYTTDTARNLRRDGFRRLRRDRSLSVYRDPVRLNYKGWRAWSIDWMSTTEEEAFRRIERGIQHD